jgi:glycine hydroxymethyltransferase
VSHVAGLIAGGVSSNPVTAGFDVVTTTTHKTLRGPRGGLILCRASHAKLIDASVFPGLQGGPHMNAVAGAAITFAKAAEPAFRVYAQNTLANARALAAALVAADVALVTGGTDNHLLVIDTVRSFGLDGMRAEQVLDRIGLATNKQVIPDDPRPPMRPSGVRLGTPACTTRGMGTSEMAQIAACMIEALRRPDDEPNLARLQADVRGLALRFPVPGIEV